MNREQHLLVILSEECSEVIKDVSKALRFGLKDGYPKSNKTNSDNISSELTDLFAVVAMLVKEGCIKEPNWKENGFLKKIKKIEKYLLYSKEKNTFQDETN